VKFPVWKTTENPRQIELVQWVRSLTHEELVDMQIVVWYEQRRRGFPKPSKLTLIFPVWGQRILAEKLQRFCRSGD
jgi:hypothetical protein